MLLSDWNPTGSVIWPVTLAAGRSPELVAVQLIWNRIPMNSDEGTLHTRSILGPINGVNAEEIATATASAFVVVPGCQVRFRIPLAGVGVGRSRRNCVTVPESTGLSPRGITWPVA